MKNSIAHTTTVDWALDLAYDNECLSQHEKWYAFFNSNTFWNAGTEVHAESAQFTVEEKWLVGVRWKWIIV